LEKTARQVTQRMREVPGIVDVNLTYDSSKPEVAIFPNRDRAADLGINIEKLGQAVQTLVGGRPVSTYEEGGESFDVRVRLAEGDRNRSEAIAALPVRTRGDRLVEFRHVADVEEG